MRCSSQAQGKKDDKTMRMARSPRVPPGTIGEQTLIISIITSLKWTELIMKGVRRQRLTGCMTMMTMMMGIFLLLGSVASNVPAARDRMGGGVAG